MGLRELGILTSCRPHGDTSGSGGDGGGGGGGGGGGEGEGGDRGEGERKREHAYPDKATHDTCEPGPSMAAD